MRTLLMIALILMASLAGCASDDASTETNTSESSSESTVVEDTTPQLDLIVSFDGGNISSNLDLTATLTAIVDGSGNFLLGDAATSEESDAPANETAEGNTTEDGNTTATGNETAAGNETAEGNTTEDGNTTATGNETVPTSSTVMGFWTLEVYKVILAEGAEVGNETAEGNTTEDGNTTATGNETAAGNETAEGNTTVVPDEEEFVDSFSGEQLPSEFSIRFPEAGLYRLRADVFVDGYEQFVQDLDISVVQGEETGVDAPVEACVKEVTQEPYVITAGPAATPDVLTFEIPVLACQDLIRVDFSDFTGVGDVDLKLFDPSGKLHDSAGGVGSQGPGNGVGGEPALESKDAKALREAGTWTYEVNFYAAGAATFEITAVFTDA